MAKEIKQFYCRDICTVVTIEATFERAKKC